jgi:uncharacterized protein YjbI with pentapeptide repeats
VNETKSRWTNEAFAAANASLFAAVRRAPVIEDLDLRGISVKRQTGPFAGVHFDKRVLRRIDFSEADLDCLFADSEIEACRFDRAKLADVLMNKSVVRGSSFDGADFESCQFIAAKLEDCTFRGARLRDRRSLSMSFVRARFHRCDFSAVVFKGAEFRAARFYDCTFEGAVFKKCDLGAVVFEGGRPDAAALEDCYL